MQKIKYWLESGEGKDILTIVVVILVGLGSFGLGRLSKSVSPEGLKIEYRGQGANVIDSIDLNTSVPPIERIDSTSSQAAVDKAFFASKKGKKYYPLGCSAGKSLKIENRVYFKTTGEAESAGYTLSSSC